jgi:hypothetical protein
MTTTGMFPMPKLRHLRPPELVEFLNRQQHPNKRMEVLPALIPFTKSLQQKLLSLLVLKSFVIYWCSIIFSIRKNLTVAEVKRE